MLASVISTSVMVRAESEIIILALSDITVPVMELEERTVSVPGPVTAVPTRNVVDSIFKTEVPGKLTMMFALTVTPVRELAEVLSTDRMAFPAPEPTFVNDRAVMVTPLKLSTVVSTPAESMSRVIGTSTIETVVNVEMVAVYSTTKEAEEPILEIEPPVIVTALKVKVVESMTISSPSGRDTPEKVWSPITLREEVP